MGNKKAKRKKSAKQRERSLQKNLVMATMADYPFLVDDNTVNHIRKSCTMFIMRGLPGSGKSTIVSSLKAKYKQAVVCSADNYFLNDETGDYNFDANHLSEAHAQCQETAHQACESSKHVVIVDNTCVRRWEMNKYCQMAAHFGYTVVIVIPRTEWAFDPVILASRNKHQVDVDVLRRKCTQFEPGLPYYWAWFLNREGSLKLLELGEKYFGICLNAVQPFQDYLKKYYEIKEASLESLMTVYNRPPRSGSVLHSTAFYANSKELAGRRQEYAERDIVKKSMGKTFALHVIGFNFTPRTIGVRLLLNHRQLLLWENEDLVKPTHPKASTQDGCHINHWTGAPHNRHGSPWQSEPSVPSTSAISASFQNFSVNEGKVTEASCHSDCSLEAKDSAAVAGEPPSSCSSSLDETISSDSEGTSNPEQSDYEPVGSSVQAMLESRPRFHPSEGWGSKAHLTLYVAPDVSAAITKSDLADIVCVERRELGRGRHVEVEGGAVRYYGEGCCAVYLDTPIRVNTLFSGKY